jgi:hypothetical protein
MALPVDSMIICLLWPPYDYNPQRPIYGKAVFVLRKEWLQLVVDGQKYVIR